MTTLITGELSSFDDDPFRVGRQNILGKGVTRLAAHDTSLLPDELQPDRPVRRMSPVVGIVQRMEAHGYIHEGSGIEGAESSRETDQKPAFLPVRLWEAAIGDAKASSAEVKDTVTYVLDEAVAGGQLSAAQAEALWLELVDGQDLANMEESDRNAMMEHLYNMYRNASDSTPFTSQPEYMIPFIKYTRATKDRGPKTIPEIQEDLNRLDMGGKVRRETVVLQIAGVMQTVLETARTAKAIPEQ